MTSFMKGCTRVGEYAIADYSMLHDYSFLGRNPRIGTASDWVWFNVPHGPQKQIACFLHAYSCFKQGLEEVGRLRSD